MRAMNHWTRIEAAIEGGNVDRLPVSLWRHFPDDDTDPGKLAAHMVRWQRRWDFDLIKFMPSGTYSVEDWGARTAYLGAANGARAVVRPGIARADDWPTLPRLDCTRGVLGQQLAALRMAKPELGDDAPILQTVFSPLTTARKLAGERVFADMRLNADALEAGLRIITEVTIDFALQSLAAGAHGIFFATQCASYRVCTAQEYLRFGARYDLEVLNALKGRSRIDLLHVHGEDIMFEQVKDYPVRLLNWHDRLTAPDLASAAQLSSLLLVGGLEENSALARGDAAAIEAQVRGAVTQTGGRRLMIGPGCVLLVATPESGIQTVIDALTRP
ncbi:MAG: uroporphyrinogen decarboxylase [Burkholderiales bacterium]|nr:uroporphyrinogen decarboxylase [Burkholderiales bacterium]